MNCDNCKKPIATGQARVFKFDGHEDRTYCARCADEIPPVNYSGTVPCQCCGAFMDCEPCNDPKVAEEIHRLVWHGDDDPDGHHGVHLCSVQCEHEWNNGTELSDKEQDFYEETQDDLYDESVNVKGREVNDEEITEIAKLAMQAAKQQSPGFDETETVTLPPARRPIYVLFFRGRSI
jgi:hypothetical protein